MCRPNNLLLKESNNSEASLARNPACSVTKKSKLNFNNYFIPDFPNFGRAPDFSKIRQWDPSIVCKLADV